MNKQYIEYYKAYLDKWGYVSQATMCVEEMSELTKALCKYERVKNCENTEKIKAVKENILEEIADVLNCVEQMQYYFGEEEVDKIRKQKIERTNKYI